MRVFTRNIDSGHGWQEVITDDSLVVQKQEICANQGYYTGDGNPEFVGKSTKEINRFWENFREIKGENASMIIEKHYQE